MALAPGTRIGVYNITAPIGAGGMGQVWQATDTTLGRQVAIKILPDAFAADFERLARFEREAKTLASLNHPHIAAIYAFEKSTSSTGAGQGVTHALVMELVEGEDLSERIKRGAIPLDEALPIATQIADALAAAHEQGIVHRDLKPANIKVRSDGTVKVLDFGLAKAMQPEVNASDIQTITSPAMTQAGVILGTAAYMSPEQAKGKPVDRRADIWAFGCVLFEMLAGARVFKGQDVSDTVAAILRAEPEWAALPAATPPLIRLLLRRCLEKDPRRRLDSAAVVRLEIADALTTPTAANLVVATPMGRRWLTWSLSLALSVVLIAALLSWAPWRTSATPPETRSDLVTPASTEPYAFALSPDGRRIVFVASANGPARLWQRSLATTTATPIAGTEGAQYPFWSPDSRSVGFFAEKRMKRVDLEGGAPQVVATAPDGRGATWNSDGVILYTPSPAAPLWRVSAAGGPPVAVTKLDQQISHRFPFFLPDGRRFLFYTLAAADTAGIYLGSLDSREVQRLTEADAAGLYLSSGWLVFVRAGPLVGQFLSAGPLVAQRLDLDRRTLVGDQVILADPVVFESGYGVAAVSVSGNGVMAYRTALASRRQLVWVDRSGESLGPLGAPDENNLFTPSLSPDGHRVAVARTILGNTDIWLMDSTRTTRFTFDAAEESRPVWSPDGRWIAFRSTRKGARDLYQGSSSRIGAEELLVSSNRDKTATDWSADGRFLLYQLDQRPIGWHLWLLPLAGDRTPKQFVETNLDERSGTFSPDGRWVAYMSTESGRAEIYVRQFVASALRGQAANTADGPWQVSTAGGNEPRWRRDGRELYYLAPSGAMMAAPIIVTGSVPKIGAPVTLFATDIVGGGGRQYDVAPDGRFLINTVLDEPSAPITLLQNWNPNAKQ